MKKILSLFLVFVLIFSFVGCGKKEEKTDDNGLDIEYYAKLGKIPECEFKIGDSVASIEERYAQNQEAENEADDHAHDIYEVIEGERTVMIDCGTLGYYYVKEKQANGISYIVCYDGAFGFRNGELVTDVKDALKGIDLVEENINLENVFFMQGATGIVLKAQFDKHTLMFVFQDNALSATALYLTEDWT